MQSRIFFITPFWVSHDHLEIITINLTQETFVQYNVENNFAASYFVWKWRHFIFQDFFINIKFNECIYQIY